MRQSAAEIDHAILDVAGGFFAAHGFTRTSVQSIADAVGYSKPGLLHRFGSKEALHRAVLDEVDETADVIVGQVDALREHPEHLDRVLELVVRRALARPGIVSMLLAAVETQQPDPWTEPAAAAQPTQPAQVTEPARAAGHRLVDAFEQSQDHPAGRLRTTLALRLIVAAALAQRSAHDADLHVPEAELVPLVRDLARGVMGQRAPA